jgi:hypothetical protein
MTRLVLIISLFLSFFQLQAQESDYILSKFFATQVDTTVLIRWTIQKGNTCEDTYIERSEDGTSFTRIGLIGGICGSPDASITYDYYDTAPLPNRTNHYRLILGQYGFTSSVQTEFVLFNEDGFLLSPNPFIELTRLRFENDKAEQYRLIIHDYSGRKILERISNENQFIIRNEDLGSGLFIFLVIKDEKVIYDGKIIAL